MSTRKDKVHRCWIASPGQGWAAQACGTWRCLRDGCNCLAVCDTGKVHQEPKRYSLVGGHGSMRDHQPMRQKGQDVPWTGEVERGSVAAPCPLGSHSPSSPALGVPFPILTPCLMPCPRPDAVLTSLTCTRAYTVCLITMSVSGHWGAMGLHPNRQVSAFPGEWEGGVGE